MEIIVLVYDMLWWEGDSGKGMWCDVCCRIEIMEVGCLFLGLLWMVLLFKEKMIK